jgi:[ribosomal protein S18]-alanine N-acetyltransferase
LLETELLEANLLKTKLPDTNQPKIELATIDDLAAISVIESKAHISPWSERMLKDSLCGSHLCWKLSINNQVLAYLIVMKSSDELELLNIAVAPSAQGQGIGKRLIEHLILFLSNNQFKSIFLEVRMSNIEATQLYQSAGFKQVGTRKNYYPHEKGREDALVMQFSSLASA